MRKADSSWQLWDAVLHGCLKESVELSHVALAIPEHSMDTVRLQCLP